MNPYLFQTHPSHVAILHSSYPQEKHKGRRREKQEDLKKWKTKQKSFGYQASVTHM
jgi:hypothetical protein